jgi:hypothetical protein
MTDCSVCCDLYNKTARQPVQCVFCEYTACMACHKTYITSTAQEAHCMNCKKKWSRAFLVGNFTRVFIDGDYARHRENLFYEREKALLPATQVHIPLILKRRGLQKMIEINSRQQATAERMYQGVELEKQRGEFYYLQNLLNSKLYLMNHSDEKKEEKQFVMKCPIGECRGFLSTRYKCGVCDGRVCSSCHIELKEEKHDCDPDLVKTVDELKKTTRNCPNCHVPIFKSSGCDQMWCVSCHTAFNWKTGQIEKGIIHNPEYFEFMRRTGLEVRNPYEVRCGGLPSYFEVLQKTRTRLESHTMTEIYQATSHHRNDTLRRLPTPLDNQDNQDMRIQFLLGEIDEKTFKSTLYQRQKEREKKLEYRQIVDTFVTVAEELFRQMDDIKVFFRQILELYRMINTQISSLNNSYKCKQSLIKLNEANLVALSE